MSLSKEEILAQTADCYMSPEQTLFFQNLLIEKARTHHERIESHRQLCNIERHADESDIASIEVIRANAAKLIEYDNEAIKAINRALAAIKNGEYGYCTQTGVEIGLQRLLVLPESLLSVESMKVLEARNKHMKAA